MSNDRRQPDHPSETYGELFAQLVADPNTGYVLRDRMREDAGRTPESALADARALVHLAELRVRDAAGGSAGSYSTPEDRSQAFVQSDAILKLEGYEGSPEYDALKRRVVAGELSADEAVAEVIAQTRTRAGFGS